MVEEALNNGLPVLVSDMVGCASEIVNDDNGLICKCSDRADLCSKIELISDVEYNNKLRLNISKMNFEMIERKQINCYL